MAAYCRVIRHGTADVYLSGLAAAGFQPGSLISGNIRGRLLQAASGERCLVAWWHPACSGTLPPAPCLDDRRRRRMLP